MTSRVFSSGVTVTDNDGDNNNQHKMLTERLCPTLALTTVYSQAVSQM